MASRAARWAGPTLLGATGVALLAWTWMGWIDPLVDSGRELYAALRLSEGAALGRDLAWFNGPLSPHLNALWFRLFGTGARTLVLANALVLAAAVALCVRLLSSVAGRFAGTAAGLVFLSVFAFGQYLPTANFNWLSPYSHEMTHGLTLSFAALAALEELRRRGRLVWAAAAGLALGLAFLTKPEVFLAAFVGTLAGLALTPLPAGRRLRAAAALLGAALVPPLAALGLLRSLSVVLGGWPHVFNRELTSLHFYRVTMGLLDPAFNVKMILRWAGAWMVVLLPAAGAALALRRSGSTLRRGVAALAGLLTLVLLASRGIAWPDATGPVPLALLALGAGAVVSWVRHPERRAQAAARLTLIAFALACLAKLALNPRIPGYGFGLVLPGTLIVVVALLDWLPAAIDHAGGAGGVFRAAALGALAAAVFGLLQFTAGFLREKTFPVGRGPDAFRAGPVGFLVNRLVEELERVVPREATMAVLPEGVMINYLVRRVTPVRFVNFLPPELAMFGEDRMLEELRARPPDYVVLVGRTTEEYGLPRFGVDYGRALRAWIASGYRREGLVGAPPFEGPSFGIELLGRR